MSQTQACQYDAMASGSAVWRESSVLTYHTHNSTVYGLSGPIWLLCPVREADDCDERIRLSTSLSQESRQFFACYGRRSVLHGCRCGTLCTSGFVDDAMFAHRGQKPATGCGCMLKTSQQMAARIWLRGLYSSWPIWVRQHRTTDRLWYLWLPCLCMLPTALARSSSGSVAIRHLLPVLWMTSCSWVLVTRKRLVLEWLNGKQNEFDTASVYTQTDPPGGITGVWYLRWRCCLMLPGGSACTITRCALRLRASWWKSPPPRGSSGPGTAVLACGCVHRNWQLFTLIIIS